MIGVVFIALLISILIMWYVDLFSNYYDHYVTCEYCKTKNYLGTNKDKEFQRDHLRQYRCKHCKADLFKEIRNNETR